MEEARNVIKEAEAEAGEAHAEVIGTRAEAAETHAEVGTPQRFEGVEGAINVSIVAFSIVFGVLLVLTAMIYAVRIFAADDDEPEANVKKNDTKPQPVAAPAKPAAVASAIAAAPAPVINASAAATPQTKIVAAITAAIMAATHGAGQIVSIQPTLALPDAAGASKNAPSFGSSAWKTSGRIALVHNRLNRSWR
ncbi:MAG: hypothetical protein IJ667_09485 [Synergistaceae bacterium]|nr:hypothetical protein [Synergistaceae bacterium]